MSYWICMDCGIEYGKATPGCATFHNGKCAVCDQEKVVTESRDYGHPDLDKSKKQYNLNK